jgi:benzoylformate decarboxylase
MRELLHDYFGGRLSRRGFFGRLVATGFSAAAARSLVHAASLGEDQEAPGQGPWYRQEGTGADLLVEQVRAAGTRYIFTNPGSLETPFFDALTDRPGLQLIMGLHEGIVISMADGYHKISREPAFVNVHAMVGTAQMAGQLYNAHRDGSSLVVTAGLSDTTIYSDDMALAPAPGASQAEMNRQFTKLSWEVRTGASNAVAIRRAYKVACTSPGGPAYVAFSTNGLRERPVAADIWPQENFLVDARPRPSTGDVEELARLLLDAKFPVLRFGDEVTKANAAAEAIQLAELLGCAVWPAGGAYVNFPSFHPQVLMGAPATAFPGQAVDLVALIGARDGGGGSTPAPLSERPPRLVAAGIDGAMLGRTQAIDLGVVGDVRETLRALVEALRARATRDRLARLRRPRLETVQQAVAAARTARLREAEARFSSDPIHPDRLDYELARAADPHAIIVNENFTGSFDFFKCGHRAGEMTQLNKAGSLGWGVGAAIGAQIAAPDRQVILNIGDGALMYSAAGFWTMARYEVPVLTVVANNLNYQMVRGAYHRYGGRMAETGQYHGAFLGDPEIDFVKLAESQGVKGRRVTSPSELEPALKQALDEVRGGRPYLLEVPIARVGGGAESTWHQKFSVAGSRVRSSQ